jgi:hypothetical protein
LLAFVSLDSPVVDACIRSLEERFALAGLDALHAGVETLGKPAAVCGFARSLDQLGHAVVIQFPPKLVWVSP